MTSPDAVNHRLTDERAVSPVIGVILMVAITVILAAVIGAYVLDLGQSASQSAPQASYRLSLDETSNNVTLSHTGGDAIVAENTRVIVEKNESARLEFSSSDAETFTVGDKVEISTNGTPSLTGWSNAAFTDSGTPFTFSEGHTIKVQIIDTKSQKIIWETDETA